MIMIMIIGNLLLLCCLICLTRLGNSAFLGQDCPSTYDANSSTGKIYKSNLNFLLSNLTSFASRTTNGFHHLAAGSGLSNRVYGLFLCRGDVSCSACENCVQTASSEILWRCPDRKVATIWYDGCLLRYSYQRIFSRVDTSFQLFLVNTQDATDLDLFNKVLEDTLDKIVNKAANDSSGKKFAVEEAKYSTFDRNIYALGQCTPDLSSVDCDKCLRFAISKFPGCCKNRQGARVIFPSCYISYEIYPFVENSTGCSGDEGTSALQNNITNVVLISVTIVLFVGATSLAWRSKKGYHPLVGVEAAGTIELPIQVRLQYDFKEIEAATDNFAIGNKIGQGGFGPVYKGTLPDGQEVAVKRLSRSSSQGPTEFKNEIALLSELRHKNLVRLLGYCLEGEEMLLIYEFVPNKSLNYHIFDPERQKLLDWSTRYKIIEGIAKGILYLHEDSRVKIIHRDLKASNVLVDQNMNPKIADFGLARILGDDQVQEYTRKRAGTRSYMAPEYVIYGRFSMKSDIYSYGVLILEIVSGKKRSKFDEEGAVGTDDLLSYALRQLRDRTPLALVDPSLGDSYVKNEAIKVIQIGLLCVKHDDEQRPTISSVLHMLNSQPISIDYYPVVEQPELLDAHIQIQDDDQGLQEDRHRFFASIFGQEKRKRNPRR